MLFDLASFGSFARSRVRALGRSLLKRKAKQTVQEETSSSNAGVWLASFFREHISAVDGDRCPSEPTCSSYSVQAFKKHGLVMGWMMTVDRLIHEGDEWQVSPVKTRNGKGKIIDPLEDNDFWWYENDRHDKVISSQK